uniref:Uncharacterized protein n=1 Tax=viral metagenome TaxID=1070528 RepID=A0A6M3L8A2_9ZZZZ
MKNGKDKIKGLVCCCCGSLTKGRQWYNRDIGYGLCDRCAGWLEGKGTTAEEMTSCYGERGVHYCINLT